MNMRLRGFAVDFKVRPYELQRRCQDSSKRMGEPSVDTTIRQASARRYSSETSLLLIQRKMARVAGFAYLIRSHKGGSASPRCSTCSRASRSCRRTARRGIGLLRPTFRTCTRRAHPSPRPAAWGRSSAFHFRPSRGPTKPRPSFAPRSLSRSAQV